jgi:imidazolonepropionase-like amidohydrolase
MILRGACFIGLSGLLAFVPSLSAQTIAITNVAIVSPQSGAIQSGQTVIVGAGRIVEVGPSTEVEVPDGATRVPGDGRYLIPGLWDMHVHPGSHSNARDIVYPLSIALGVTGMRNMQGDCLDCGLDHSWETELARRQAVADGTLGGPRVVASSDFAGSHGQAVEWTERGSSPEAPGTPDDARAFVRLARERGADFIKIYDMLPREAYLAAVDEAKTLGLTFAGHVPVEVQASEASDLGQASIEHPRTFGVLIECSAREDELRARLVEEFAKAPAGERFDSAGSTILPLLLAMAESYDPPKCEQLAQRFVQNGTWIVPTLMTGREPGEVGPDWRSDPYARFLTTEEREFSEWYEEELALDLGEGRGDLPVRLWERDVTRALYEAGVKILAGSDAGALVYWGIGLHQELELLVSAGMTEADALRAATLGPAEFLEATDSLGTVEPGKVADLVLLDANPMVDISNTQRIRAVIARGRLFDREALDRLLEEAEAAARSR